MKKLVVGGGMIVVGVVVYCVYLAAGAGTTVGGYSAIKDLNECARLSLNMPGSTEKAKAFLHDIKNRLPAESAAANAAQGTVAMADAMAGHKAEQPSLTLELQKCIEDLKRGVESADKG